MESKESEMKKAGKSVEEDKKVPNKKETLKNGEEILCSLDLRLAKLCQKK